MAPGKINKTILAVVAFFFVMLSVVQCKKEGVNVKRIARALVEQPDSTVFSPFYDSMAVTNSDITPGVNDVIKANGVLNIVRSNCASVACHGGGIKPRLTTYGEIKSLVVPGNPQASLLFQLITTSDVNKAMPPINYGVDLSVTEKTKIYNWIKNGAKETPDLADIRPAVISLLVNGCGSANCHNQATVGGEWARRKLISVSPGDTVSYVYINPGTGSTTIYAQLKEPLLSQVWNAYKDSVRRFYADTVANASFRPYKTFNTPVTAANRRGPLNSYDDIVFDSQFPKSVRSVNSVVYTDPVTLQKFYVRGDYLNATSSMLSRVDSTILLANPRTKVFATVHQGDMAFGDGGLSPSEIALIKQWYFTDPNIPDVWKYGIDGTGIFKYRKTGKIITK
jgi:Planctomycete cytochrome C